MKRKIFTSLLVLICLFSLAVLTSCDAILDLIFGPNTPPDSDEPSHVHAMEKQTFNDGTCTGQSVAYYKCADCGKSYLDEDGEQLIDEDLLATGHIFVLKYTESEHFRQCALCSVEMENSRETHTSGRYRYNSNEHYKQCDVCNAIFDKAYHEANVSCSVCGRSADYVNMCNSRYGYERLSEFDNCSNMQKLYDKIDSAVQSAHDDVNYNIEQIDIANNSRNYAIEIDCKSYRLTANEAFVTVATYSNDNPLFYWLDSTAGLSSHQDLLTHVDYADTVKLCVVSDYADGAARTAQNVSIYSEIDDYMSYVSNETDPYNIALALHDKIIRNIDYAYAENGTPQSASWAHNIVGAFDAKHKSAVCEGYAKAFQLLLNACSVNNAYVIGTSRGEGHAWNLVQLDDGNWYWYDLTWDDQPSANRGVIYNYFCKTNGEFTKDHTVSTVKNGMNYMYDLPAAAAEDYQSDGLELNERFTQNGFTYQYIGYNCLSVYKCLTVGDDGVAVIPSYVNENGKTYKVTQIESEAFATYKYGDDGKLVSIVSPAVTKVIIPSTVDLIYNKSFVDCNTLIRVEFEDFSAWQRYGMTGKTPIYEQIQSIELSNDFSACLQIKQLYNAIDNKNYYYVWIKTDLLG